MAPPTRFVGSITSRKGDEIPCLGIYWMLGEFTFAPNLGPFIIRILQEPFN